MAAVVRAVFYLTAAGYLALAGLALLDWLRNRGRARAWLTVALAALAVVPLVSRVEDFTGATPAALQVVAIVCFMLSGYGILRFRDAFFPLTRRELLVATAGAALATLAALALVLTSPPRGVAAAGSVVLITAWGALVGEPIVRFWLASRGLPRIQRYRMRSLGVGLGVLVLILVVSTLAGAAARTAAGQVASQLVALAMVPVIYISFAPPAWVRNQWRLGVETQLNAANRDLLIFSPSSAALAGKAVDWAARLVGGTGAFIVDADGTRLASIGLAGQDAEGLVKAATGVAADSTDLTARVSGSLIVVPLPLQRGRGILGVLAGPFTPVFGEEEVGRLESYASSIAAGIERTRVTERLSAMEHAKSEFLNLASHELRGPVTVLRGYVSMFDTGVLGNLNDNGRRAIAVMAAKVVEMNALIEEMIEAARLEEGRLELKTSALDLRDVVRAAADSIAPLVDGQHRLVVEPGPRRVPVVADADRLQTILTNLIDNAIKYSPGGGDVRCLVAVEHERARVSVEDHGLGIAPDGMHDLFTRFGRVTTRDTAHIPGTGLGLYLSRELARMHGGDITVETEVGRGSVFTLELPLAKLSPSKPPIRSESEVGA